MKILSMLIKKLNPDKKEVIEAYYHPFQLGGPNLDIGFIPDDNHIFGFPCDKNGYVNVEELPVGGKINYQKFSDGGFDSYPVRRIPIPYSWRKKESTVTSVITRMLLSGLCLIAK
ncbi:MAG: hypothetical protein Q7J27_04620 [Syntrophales bacterium]|nr:hypothetical protein [Syntrophales bacterium]